MKSRRSRSRFDGLSDKEKVTVREAAVTAAQQGLRKPMVQASDARHGGSTPMVTATDAERRGAGGGGAPADPRGHHPHHADQRHQPGGMGGTYDSSHPGPHRSEGTTDPDTSGGVEVMARVIHNQRKVVATPHPQSTQKAPPWPGARKRGAGPMMPRRTR